MKQFSVTVLIVMIVIAVSAGCGGSSSDTPEQNSRYSWSNETDVEPSEGSTPEESPSPSPSASQNSTTVSGPPTPPSPETPDTPPAPQGPLICRFWGTASIGGGAAPDGTNIQALVGGVVKASASTTAGNYRIDVTGDNSGKTVAFKINGTNATSETWEFGGNIRTDLTIP